LVVWPEKETPPSPHTTSPTSMASTDSASNVGRSVASRIKSLEKSSKLPPCSPDLVYLEWDDLFVEDMLGVGGFASVCLATCPKLWGRQNKGNDPMENSASINSYDFSWAQSETSFFSGMSVMSMDESILKGAYAVKYLSNRTMSDPKQYVTGACDLAGEAFLLSRLSHPNIIQLFAVTSGEISEAFNKTGGFFLVLEALETTLTKELDLWSAMQRAPIDILAKRSQRNSIPTTRFRLDIAADVAKGMLYLHNHNIIFRDLKPDNVGIDRAGQVRLFDFGLAREVKDGRLKGVAGSMMYLAPETILGKFTCKSSDVYSFGILCWELMSMQPPYPDFNEPSQLQKAVSVDGHRPDLSSVPEEVAPFISACWHSSHEARPQFVDIISSLGALKHFGKTNRVLSGHLK
jgi:serine/threonine protein kinase